MYILYSVYKCERIDTSPYHSDILSYLDCFSIIPIEIKMHFVLGPELMGINMKMKF